MTIAALYIQPDGIYANRDGIDPWPESRDARLYAGPHPVIAHPPCARWGNYWFGSPSDSKRFKLGEDGGCFAAALHAVRVYGGVLEHPAGSRAWKFHGLKKPGKRGWREVDAHGWACEVEQGHYGHEARKATWLYKVGGFLEPLKWGPSEGKRPLEHLSKRQRAATPPEFADLLIKLVRGY